MNAYGYLVVGAIALAAVAGGAYFLDGNLGLGDTPTGNMVKEAYELSSNTDLEVMKVEDEGSLKRVVLSDGESVIEQYITEDGEYLVGNPIRVSDYTQSIEARNDFVTCLEDEGAQFYGILAGEQALEENPGLANHTQMAQLQIQTLGGLNGLENIFADPQAEDFPQEAVLNNGVVWDIDGELRSGILSIEQLTETTGCEYAGPDA